MVYQRCRDWGYIYVHNFLTYLIHKGDSTEREDDNDSQRQEHENEKTTTLVHNKRERIPITVLIRGKGEAITAGVSE